MGLFIDLKKAILKAEQSCWQIKLLMRMSRDAYLTLTKNENCICRKGYNVLDFFTCKDCFNS